MTAVVNLLMNGASPALAMGIPAGACRASEGQSGAVTPPDPEVVVTTRRRLFSGNEQRARLAEASDRKGI
jgi:hypothetical protein